MRDLSERRERIRALNDEFLGGFRKQVVPGELVITPGVEALGDIECSLIIRLVENYEDFTPEIDPSGLHEFGRIELDGALIYFRIDYYDLAMEHGSPDPSNPDVTTRVLTIMLVSEY